ncbi:MAG: hypothetical protein HC866_15080 [Leptolyngbyaceae cyanobacterium RU_5_1]|nr:hypothetical protein [Leptolyngbyaceae cyanobacterium RU_5_1]
MKPELKRIEAALQQLANQPRIKTGSEPWLDPAAYSAPSVSADYVSSLAEAMLQQSQLSEEAGSSVSSTSIVDRSLDLPDFALPQSSDRQETNRYRVSNPALAINLLKEMQTRIGSWIESLQEVTQHVQALYEEGPIIDGWLESYNPDGKSSDAQHSIVEQALKYLNETHRLPEQTVNGFAAVSQPQTNSEQQDSHIAQYRLCGLNEDGQIWYRYCPADQVPDVSLAIVRYQRLQNLLTRKRSLETRLHHLTEALVVLQGQMAE